MFRWTCPRWHIWKGCRMNIQRSSEIKSREGFFFVKPLPLLERILKEMMLIKNWDTGNNLHKKCARMAVTITMEIIYGWILRRRMFCRSTNCFVRCFFPHQLWCFRCVATFRITRLNMIYNNENQTEWIELTRDGNVHLFNGYFGWFQWVEYIVSVTI